MPAKTYELGNKELRKFIKDNKLAKKFREKYGKNYTQAKNDILIQFHKENKIENKIENKEDIELLNKDIEEYIIDENKKEDLNNNNIEDNIENNIKKDIEEFDLTDLEYIPNIDNNEKKENKVTYKIIEEDEKKANLYLDKFPKLKNDIKNLNFRNSNEKLKFIQSKLNSCNSNDIIKNTFMTILQSAEHTPYIDNYIYLEGFGENIGQQKQTIDDLIDEILCEYADDIQEYMNLKPEYRLGIVILCTMYATHSSNINSRRQQAAVKILENNKRMEKIKEEQRLRQIKLEEEARIRRQKLEEETRIKNKKLEEDKKKIEEQNKIRNNIKNREEEIINIV